MYARINKDNNYRNSIGLLVEGASEYLCDNENDIENLPTSVAVGSSATCIENGSTFIFAPSKKWLKYGGVSIFGGDN